jgi:wyosine [tRNA(Phe)-imidazoG37] synthetase (radical SAM superfamily)
VFRTKTVYGPVPSWRLGRSLGVDVVCREKKVCSFDCVYCQLGPTKNKIKEREIFVSKERIKEDLSEVIGKINADVVTFSGTSEPTLASNLGEIIDVVREYTHLPLAVLTNSSFMFNKDIRDELKKLDIVVAKLDAPNSKLFQKINRPAEGLKFNDILEGVKEFRREFKGKLALQMMFIDLNKGYADEMAEIAEEIKADEVQINTPLRSSPIKPLNEREIEKIERSFLHLNAISVYKEKKPITYVYDQEEVLRRRKTVS